MKITFYQTLFFNFVSLFFFQSLNAAIPIETELKKLHAQLAGGKIDGTDVKGLKPSVEMLHGNLESVSEKLLLLQKALQQLEADIKVAATPSPGPSGPKPPPGPPPAAPKTPSVPKPPAGPKPPSEPKPKPLSGSPPATPKTPKPPAGPPPSPKAPPAAPEKPSPPPPAPPKTLPSAVDLTPLVQQFKEESKKLDGEFKNFDEELKQWDNASTGEKKKLRKRDAIEKDKNQKEKEKTEAASIQSFLETDNAKIFLSKIKPDAKLTSDDDQQINKLTLELKTASGHTANKKSQEKIELEKQKKLINTLNDHKNFLKSDVKTLNAILGYSTDEKFLKKLGLITSDKDLFTSSIRALIVAKGGTVSTPSAAPSESPGTPKPAASPKPPAAPEAKQLSNEIKNIITNFLAVTKSKTADQKFEEKDFKDFQQYLKDSWTNVLDDTNKKIQPKDRKPLIASEKTTAILNAWKTKFNSEIEEFIAFFFNNKLNRLFTETDENKALVNAIFKEIQAVNWYNLLLEPFRDSFDIEKVKTAKQKEVEIAQVTLEVARKKQEISQKAKLSALSKKDTAQKNNDEKKSVALQQMLKDAETALVTATARFIIDKEAHDAAQQKLDTITAEAKDDAKINKIIEDKKAAVEFLKIIDKKLQASEKDKIEKEKAEEERRKKEEAEEKEKEAAKKAAAKKKTDEEAAATAGEPSSEIPEAPSLDVPEAPSLDIPPAPSLDESGGIPEAPPMS